MGGTDGCKRIVQTKPGARTGETLYRTEDGRWWTDEIGPMTSSGTGGTGVTIEYVHGDRMCPHR